MPTPRRLTWRFVSQWRRAPGPASGAAWEGGFRVEAVVPGDLGEEAHGAVLAVLAGADRYGHRYTDAAQAVWAELDEEWEQSG